MAAPCPKCKADLPKGVSECPKCGAKLKKKKKPGGPPIAPDTGTTKRIVRKKSAIPSFDDSQVVATQKAEYDKYKERESKREEARPKAPAAPDKSARRRQEEEARIGREREELEREKRRLADEKRRLEAERELEVERAKLEQEKQRLAAEKKARQAALEKKKQAALSRRKAKEPPKAADQPDDELPAWDEPAPPRTPTKAPAKKSLVQQQQKKGSGPQKAPVRTATAVADDEAVPAAITVVKAESVGDWVDEIKGVDWKKIGIRFGIPGAVLLLLLVLWGPGLAYGVIDLPKVKARPEAMVVPKSGDIPGREPPPKTTHTWLPLGPLMVHVPKEGPIAVDWELRGEKVKFEENVTLYFQGFSLRCARYGNAAIFNALNKAVPDAFLEQFAGGTVDQKLVKHCLELTPDEYSYFQGKGGVDKFKAGIQFKLNTFEEIKTGLISVAYGNTNGYYFGTPGQGEQRIELFDSQGQRYSFVFRGDGPYRSQRVLKLSQPAQDAHWRFAKGRLQQWMKKLGDRNEPFALFKAAMWAAGGSVGNKSLGDNFPAQVDQIRSYLSVSLNRLGGADDVLAKKAFDELKPTDVAGYRLMLRLLGDPRKKVRDRISEYFSQVLGYKLAPGQAGIEAARAFVRKKEEQAAREKK